MRMWKVVLGMSSALVLALVGSCGGSSSTTGPNSSRGGSAGSGGRGPSDAGASGEGGEPADDAGGGSGARGGAPAGGGSNGAGRANGGTGNDGGAGNESGTGNDGGFGNDGGAGNDGGSGGAPICVPNASTCMNNGVITCLSDGSGYSPPTDCEAAACIRGACYAEVIVDDADSTRVTVVGDWTFNDNVSGFYGTGYIHDQDAGKGTKSVTFRPLLDVAADYDVFARWSAYPNRAINSPFEVAHVDGSSVVRFDQTIAGGVWNLVGRYRFTAGTAGSITVRTDGTSGYVVADAVRFVPVAE